MGQRYDRMIAVFENHKERDLVRWACRMVKTTTGNFTRMAVLQLAGQVRNQALELHAQAKAKAAAEAEAAAIAAETKADVAAEVADEIADQLASSEGGAP